MEPPGMCVSRYVWRLKVIYVLLTYTGVNLEDISMSDVHWLLVAALATLSSAIVFLSPCLHCLSSAA